MSFQISDLRVVTFPVPKEKQTGPRGSRDIQNQSVFSDLGVLELLRPQRVKLVILSHVVT